MPYTAVYNEAGYIEIIYEGVLTFANVSVGILDTLSLAKKYNCWHCLGDFREVTLQLSMAEIYEIPIQVFNASQQCGLQIGKFKRAFIVDQRNYEKFKFFEMVSRNRVQIVKIFSETEAEAAMDWLFDH